MEYVELQYERIANLIAVAASHRESDFNNLFIEPSRNIVYIVKFSDYVKSQIHLNIVSRLFVRQFTAYKSVYDSLEGKVMDRENFELVLQYFYEDLSNFLIYNPYNIKLVVKVDVEAPWLQGVHYNFTETQRSLLDLLKCRNNFEQLLELMGDNTAFEIIDTTLGAEDLDSKIDSYTVAAILRMCNKQIVFIDGGIYADNTESFL